MESDATIAPRERINIVYRSQTEVGQEERELPLKLMVLGDFSIGGNSLAVQEREPVQVDKNNLDDVIADLGIRIEMMVTNRMSQDQTMLPVSIEIESIGDFSPDNIIRQVEPLRRLYELRNALATLKGPMGNSPRFKNALKELLLDPECREELKSLSKKSV